MTPGKYNFPACKRGDTFNGASFQISLNGVPVDFSGAVATIQVRRFDDTPVILSWTSADGSITFAANVVTMQPKTGVQMQVEPGVYQYDLQVVLASGVTNTYVEGSFEIVKDITR